MNVSGALTAVIITVAAAAVIAATVFAALWRAARRAENLADQELQAALSRARTHREDDHEQTRAYLRAVEQGIKELQRSAPRPRTPRTPRTVTEPEHVYGLPRGSVLEDPTTRRLWLVTEIVNPPRSGSHDPLLVRLDANPRTPTPSSQLLPPGTTPATGLRVLREGIAPLTKETTQP